MIKLYLLPLISLIFQACLTPPSEPGAVKGMTTKLDEAVQIIIAINDLPHGDHWSLSEDGHKIAYQAHATSEILLLEDNQILALDKACSWAFSNTNFIGCDQVYVDLRSENGSTTSVALAKEIIEITEDKKILKVPRTIVNADNVPDLYQLLDIAQEINLNPDWPYILSTVQRNQDQSIKQMDIIYNLTDDDLKIVKEQYADILIEQQWGRRDYRDSKVISPNKQYYFILDMGLRMLTIYSVENDASLITFYIKDGSEFINYKIRLGGWTADSSGVIFQAAPPTGATGYRNTPFSHIRKLNIPQPQ